MDLYVQDDSGTLRYIAGVLLIVIGVQLESCFRKFPILNYLLGIINLYKPINEIYNA